MGLIKSKTTKSPFLNVGRGNVGRGIMGKGGRWSIVGRKLLRHENGM